MVTLFFSLNDVKNNDSQLQARGASQRFRMTEIRPGRVNLERDDAPLFWIERSVLNQTVSFRLGRYWARRSYREVPVDYLVYAEEEGADWTKAWRQTRELLLATRSQSEALGARYALVSASTPQGIQGPEAWLRILVQSYPAMESGAWNIDKPDQRLAAIAEANDLPFLALEPLFRGLTQQEGKALHWKIDGHWNVEGNDEAGKAIALFLVEQQLVPIE